MSRRSLLVTLTLVLTVMTAAPAAATTRYAAPGGIDDKVDCATVTAPCTVAAALAATVDQDTLSLAAGTYSTVGLALPDRAVHWVATDPRGPGRC
jgi:hypothetical protein